MVDRVAGIARDPIHALASRRGDPQDLGLALPVRGGREQVSQLGLAEDAHGDQRRRRRTRRGEERPHLDQRRVVELRRWRRTSRPVGVAGDAVGGGIRAGEQRDVAGVGACRHDAARVERPARLTGEQRRGRVSGDEARVETVDDQHVDVRPLCRRHRRQQQRPHPYHHPHQQDSHRVACRPSWQLALEGRSWQRRRRSRRRSHPHSHRHSHCHSRCGRARRR